MTPTLNLCLVGPLIGRRPGQLTTQATVLASLFADANYRVLAVSDSPNRWIRFADIVSSLARRRRELDVVLVGVYGRRSFVVEDVASSMAKRFGLPLILTLHGGALPAMFASYPRWSRRVLARADAIVAPSAFLARAVAPFGLKVHVIPNVVDLRLLPYRWRPRVAPRLLWMRSFYAHYRPEMAIDVVTALRRRGHEATLVMAGRDKGLQRRTARLARSRSVAAAVRFPGFLDAAAKARALDASDIFINTNAVDNTPVAVVEACAAGLPVVTTDVGGVRDLLQDGETAMIVPDGDARAMADAIERLLRDEDLAARLSRNGRELAARCSWDRVRDQWETLLSTVRA